MASVPVYDHIVVVVEENHSASDIIGNTSQAPFINQLAAGGAVLSNFSAETHPSQPNYFALYAGSTFGTTDDNPHTESGPTIATILQAAGKTFTGFVDEPGGSDFNHDPWVSFPEGTSVQKDFNTFPSLFPSGDYSGLPSVSYVIPGINNDMHDGTVQQGDTWLQSNLGQYAQWATTHNSLLVIVGDENDGSSSSNLVPAILYGAHVVPGVYNTPYDHYNLLSTILGSFGLTGPNQAASAVPIQVFGTQGSLPSVTEGLTTDTGASATDKVTSNPALSGTGEANGVVHFTVDGTAIAQTATATAAGAWSLTPSGLADGAHTVVASQTNATGTGTASLSFTLDTTAPVVAITSPGGTVATAAQSIAGTVDTADAGTTVSLFDNAGATPVATATVQSDGTWSTPVTLAQGANSLVARDTDLAGNTGTSTARSFSLTTPVAIPSVTEGLTTDTGASATDKVTSNPALSGTGEANGVVHFTVDGTAIAQTATATAAGAWSLTPSGLADGAHTVVASQTNATGTGTASLSFTLDTTAPVVAITSPGGTVATAAQSIAGTVDTADAGTTVSLFDNAGATPVATATVQSDGTWSTPVTLAQGANSLVARDTDLAGNTGTSTARSFSVAAPVAIPSVTEGLTTDTGASATDKVTSNPALSGTGEANGVVHFTVDGTAIAQTATATAAGAWSLTPSGLADGAHTVVASQTNATGTGTASLSFTLDTTAPVVAITSPGGSVATAAQSIAGTVDTADAGTTVSLFDNAGTTPVATATVQSDGTWSTPVTLAQGANSLVARDTDLAGNTGTSTARSFSVSAPVAIPSVTEGLTTDTGASATDKVTSNPALSGTGEANGVVHFTVDGTAIAQTATATAAGAWSLTPSGLTDGAHTVVASQTNATGTGTASLSFTLDTTAPVVAITSPGGTVATAAQSIAGTVDTADAGTTVSLFDNAGTTPVATATVQSDGTWSTPVTLAQGANSLVARDTDLAGNTGTSTARSFSLTTPVAIPSVTEGLTTDTGASATDKVTSNPALSGTGEANGVVHFTVDGTAIAQTATATAAGAWSLTPSGLADGAHTVVASQTNATGTGTASLSFTLDTTAPVVAITSPGGTVATAAQSIAGTVDTADAGTTVSLFDNAGTTPVATATVQSDGTWSTPVTLAQGANSLVARDTDLAGNTGTSTARSFSLTTATQDTGVSGTGGNVAVLAGQTVAGRTFGVTVTGGPGTVSNAGGIVGTSGIGVYLLASGGVSNEGTIAGGQAGTFISGGSGNLTNSGTISATGAGSTGVDLEGGGTASNTSTGLITGQSYGIYIEGGSGTVSNAGRIVGNDASGVGLDNGALTNSATGTITGVTAGFFANGPATLDNAGAIRATGSGTAAADLEGGGTVNNRSGATLSGDGFGVYLDGPGTVTNAGTITGGSLAVDFAGTGANRLIVDPGAIFQGGVEGGGGTLELAAGTGLIAGIGGSAFHNFGNVTLDAGAIWTLDGSNTVSTMRDNGIVHVNAFLKVADLDPTSLGSLVLKAGSTLELGAAPGADAAVNFLGGGQLLLDDASTFGSHVGLASYTGPQVTGFGGSDVIDLKGFHSAGAGMSFDSATGLLQLTNSSAQVASLNFQASTLGTGTFHTANDGANGLLLTRV